MGWGQGVRLGNRAVQTVSDLGPGGLGISSVANGEPRMVVEEEKSIARSSLWMTFLIRACVATGPRAHLCLLPCEPAHRACLTHLPGPGVRTQPWTHTFTRSTPPIWARHSV